MIREREIILDSEDEARCTEMYPCLPPCDPSLPPPAVPKQQLYKILNAFQNSHDYGVYICQKFRDPRKYYIDSYYGEVADEAFGIVELAALVGKPGEPLTESARREFSRFADTLRELAHRIDLVLN